MEWNLKESVGGKVLGRWCLEEAVSGGADVGLEGWMTGGTHTKRSEVGVWRTREDSKKMDRPGEFGD